MSGIGDKYVCLHFARVFMSSFLMYIVSVSASL